jgi:hypothetical protein
MDAKSAIPSQQTAISADAPTSAAAQPSGVGVEGALQGTREPDLRLPTRRTKSLIVVLLVGSHLLCVLVGFLLSRTLPGGSSAESKWAREVAEHFLEAFVNENTTAARTVSTREFQKEIKQLTTSGGPLSWSITSHEFNERSGQGSFKGIIVGRSANPDTNKRSFTLLMEKEEGRWKVSSFTLGAYR